MGEIIINIAHIFYSGIIKWIIREEMKDIQHENYFLNVCRRDKRMKAMEGEIINNCILSHH